MFSRFSCLYRMYKYYFPAQDFDIQVEIFLSRKVIKSRRKIRIKCGRGWYYVTNPFFKENLLEKLWNCEVWWWNVVKCRKHSLEKFGFCVLCLYYVWNLSDRSLLGQNGNSFKNPCNQALQFNLCFHCVFFNNDVWFPTLHFT